MYLLLRLYHAIVIIDIDSTIIDVIIWYI